MQRKIIRGIYRIINSINEKIYIGESMDIYRRWDEHKEELNNNNHHSYKLQNAWNTYGQDNFKFEVIEEINNDNIKKIGVYELILYIKEDEYIKQYNTIEQGYNVENTLYEMLNGEKPIFGTKINIKHIKMLEKMIKNLNENNGVYTPSEKITKKNNRKEELKLEKLKKKSKKPQTKQTTKEIIQKSKYAVIYDSNNYIQQRNNKYFLSELNEEGYNVKALINNKMFQILRDNNIYYYDENKINTPYEEYLNKNYFTIIEKHIEEYDKHYKTIYITNEGKEFLINFFLDNNYIDRIDI